MRGRLVSSLAAERRHWLFLEIDVRKRLATVIAHDEAGVLLFNGTTAAGSGEQTKLCRPLKSTSHSPVGKPVAIIVGNRQALLTPVANWLHRRSNTMADEFVDRLASRAEIEKVVHRTYRIRRTLNAMPEYAAVNLPRPSKQQIRRARCLLATIGRREAAGGHCLGIVRQ
jgi:hypothetical protein